MKLATLLAAVACTALAGGAIAQDNTGANQPTPGTTGTTAPGMSATGNSPTDHNQAVATTPASTATPAHGSNSFTMVQARRRIAHHGFSHVRDLTKDDQGVWHGTAMQSGNPVKVWEDYKGSVGTE